MHDRVKCDRITRCKYNSENKRKYIGEYDAV